ncbi:hypothetical protein PDE_01245 [Penicillium oxalicum 114-2]|uniref:Uncharacterized protein n=1 Tax=Penicillium oxalicum (strain 114-2 / CGMCC 5302) TaxID=933388 RepID=S7Z810_PENO1|nr:hypothetical protein PDE_01245 [Penicillium oxalicum 114-2]
MAARVYNKNDFTVALEAYEAIPEMIVALESDLEILEAYLVENGQIELEDDDDDDDDDDGDGDDNPFVSIKKRLGK